jgi:UDP-N-acetylmuramyl pentapeptide phosphotransferase/UDP-N-acetylglucosamine-1-phosphate transferase
MSAVRRFVNRMLLSGAAAIATRAVLGTVRGSAAAPRLERVNHRGAPVSLAAGPALAVAASTTAAAGAASPALASAALIAGLGSGAVGLYDDVVGHRPDQKAAKGFKGHLTALRDGKVTSGLVKIAGIGISAMVAASLVGRARRSDRPVTDLVIDTGLIAGAANLTNLLDLRPGRALKAGIAVSGTLSVSDGLLTGPAAAAAALLQDDLDERVMLGDAGANSFGALIGLAAASRHSRAARLAVLAGIVGLTLASEKVSFTQVIESTPVLRDLDDWGRRAR